MSLNIFKKAQFLRSLKKEFFISIVLGFLGFFLVIWVLYSFISNMIINQALSKARLESKTIYHFRNYLAQVSPHIQRKDLNVSYFACTPAYTVNQVAKLLRDKEHLYIRQVSDKWRNPNDKPNKYELKAIKFFKTHKNAYEFWEIHDFSDTSADSKAKHIFYAYPLKVKKSCLVCHGDPKKDVPKDIYEHIVKTYGVSAFNYKVGDVRGIISIKIPYNEINEKIDFIFLVVSVLIGIIFISGFFIFYNINKNITEDIDRLLNYFSSLISKGKYKTLKEKMNFKEFETLKNQINSTVNLIKKYQKELFKKLYFNFLTNLHNRAKFMEFLSKNKSKNRTIILLNIDKFREVNSFFGVEVGDKLIKEISKRLKELKKEFGFLLYHLDIDEFAIIPSKNLTDKELEEYIKKILMLLEAPYKIDNNEIVIRFRVGVSKKDYLDAEVALALAKEIKKDIVFEEKIQNIKKDYGNNIKWLKQIKSAIENLRIVPFYQPIVDKNGHVVKYEALVRMYDGEGNIVPPNKFLEVAKKSRLYNEITKIIIDKVIKKIREKDIKVSVNISLEDIEDENMREYIINRVKNFEKRENLTFEIVENEDVRESEILKEFLHTLQEMGVEIYIDDFGSGYANFDYLLKLNPNGVKIDGSLIKDILHNKNNEIIVKTIINFAKETGIKTVAEFVESKEIFDKLKQMGVDYFQGYYFSPPKKEI